MLRALLLMFCSLQLSVSAQVQAQEMRQLNHIASPEKSMLPAGARMLVMPRPVPAELIEFAAQQIVAAWNTPKFADLLADYYFDKSRLLDTLAAEVPRDAKLRLLGILGSQTLEQYVQDDENGVPRLYSRVSVTLRTQLEYNDAQAGLQRLDGTNELILLLAGETMQ